MWRLPSALRRNPLRNSAKDDKNGTLMQALQPRSSPGELDPYDQSLRLRRTDSSSFNESHETNCRKLQALVQRVRSIHSSPSHVDAAYHEFSKHKDTCSSLCHAILQDEIRPVRTLSSVAGVDGSLTRRDSSMDSPPAAAPDSRSSFSGRSLAEVVTGGGPRPSLAYESRLVAIGELKNCLEAMADAFQASLADTYKSYERDATPEMVDLLFNSKRFRREAVHRMRNASVTSIRSADPQFFPRYEIRFRDYEKVKQELSEIRRLLQCAESGISPSRPVQGLDISPRGDAILEFANLAADQAADEPVLRFRVSSYMLAETSPIFARMFSGHAASLHLHEAEDISEQLPPPPTSYVCTDGSEVKLYRMPQREVNRLGSMEVLLHAAHMHNEMVPREVGFDQFVAIAECSMRYKSTSPLEIVVEHRWLPQWMHKGAENMPDGLLAISYAFGVRQLFTRMSKSAILDLVDEKDLQSKPWPQKIKDKIWDVRCAKVAQVYACCTGTIQEYIHTPARDAGLEPERVPPTDPRNRLNEPAMTPRPAAALTSSPRCPKGNHSCDAANLGWMMLGFNEMDLLPQIVHPSVLLHLPEAEPRPRSLAQMIDVLRRMPSPAFPVHRGGVCDPGPSFRAAIADIYDSIAGLTLHDISCKSHGWALSKHQMDEPQPAAEIGLERMAALDRAYTVAQELPDGVRLQILDELDDVDDLQAAARTNRGFYQTYQGHEGDLVRKFLRGDRARGGSSREPVDDLDDGKVLKTVSDQMKSEGPGVRADLDAVTLQSDDESDVSESEPESDDDTISIDGTSTPLAHELPGQPSAEPPRYVESESNPHCGTEGPPQPRQPPVNSPRSPHTVPPKQSHVMTAAADEAPMTDEEAARILWPPPLYPEPLAARAMPAASVEGIREKFRMGDVCFVEGLEEKMLVVMGQKQLRSDHDRRIGLVKKDAGGGGGGCGRPATAAAVVAGVVRANAGAGCKSA
ncbi:hypothetical protein HRG_006908 [Hirsutella rhossiliensis]|uniref:BTB domain-containing protein n=1 Tax=Hirsutella rhossiliensis TaxID=111463 RepID=A0A9P8MTF4_9HYPO|nr:uncharacterized protein HRG_06908 [Hirsutella rhossiliensis]KAH0961828.1 hypothetical protein HRG_06908 [Hirsutella rhossiliensis]